MSNIVTKLRSRTVLARFDLPTRPMNFAESLENLAKLEHATKSMGRIIHYHQFMCPVTKERLHGLTVLLEDFKPLKNKGLVVENGEPVADLSLMEQKILECGLGVVSLERAKNECI